MPFKCKIRVISFAGDCYVYTDEYAVRVKMRKIMYKYKGIGMK